MIEAVFRRQRQIKRWLRGTYIYRVFGEKLFHNRLWVHDRRAVAGGLALGLFVALTPTIPLQMLLAACGAIYFRLNLPIAVTACWVTNPLTLAPIYLTAWRLGRYVLEEVVFIEDFFDFYTQETRIGSVVRQSAYLWTGSLILGASAAVLAYVAVRLIWALTAMLLGRIRVSQKNTSGPQTPPGD